MMRPNQAARWIVAGVSVFALSGAGAALATTEPPDGTSMGTDTTMDTGTMDTGTMDTGAAGDTSMTEGSMARGAGPSDCPSITSDSGPADSEAMGTEAMGTEAMGTEAMGTEAMGTEAMGSAAPAAPDVTSGSTMGTMVDVSAPPMSGPVVQLVETDEHGPILVDANCRTLYVFTPDDASTPTCEEECATAWPPLFVPEGEVPPLADELDPALFSVVEHIEGPMLAVAGWPLYYYAEDLEPGEINGQGVGGVWWVVSPDGTPIESAEDGDSTVTEGSEAPGASDAMGSEPMSTVSETTTA